MKNYTIKLTTLILTFFYFTTISNGQDIGFVTPQVEDIRIDINDAEDVIEADFYTKTDVVDSETVEMKFFDQKDRLIFKKYYDNQGNLFYDEKGVAIYAYDYDQKSNVISIKYYDEFEMPYSISDAGPASIKMKYDNQNRLEVVAYCDIEGDLFQGGGAPIVQYQYNEDNQVIEERMYLKAGVLIDYIAPIIRYKYNIDGRVSEQTYYDEKGEATSLLNDKLDKEDFSKITFNYLGEEAYPTFFNLEGQEVEPY